MSEENASNFDKAFFTQKFGEFFLEKQKRAKILQTGRSGKFGFTRLRTNSFNIKKFSIMLDYCENTDVRN